jgi:hypothetical protein
VRKPQGPEIMVRLRCAVAMFALGARFARESERENVQCFFSQFLSLSPFAAVPDSFFPSRNPDPPAAGRPRPSQNTRSALDILVR